MAIPVSRTGSRAHAWVRAKQLDRAPGSAGRRPADTAVLDIGVQDTSPDGALWALPIWGLDVSALPGRQLVLLWTPRGAPHFYRRADLPKVVAAVAAARPQPARASASGSTAGAPASRSSRATSATVQPESR